MGSLFEELLRRLRERDAGVGSSPAAGQPSSSPALPLSPSPEAEAATEADAAAAVPERGPSAEKGDQPAAAEAAPSPAAAEAAAAPAPSTESATAPSEAPAAPSEPAASESAAQGGQTGSWRLVLPQDPLDLGISHGDDPGQVIPLEQARTTLPPSEIIPADEAAYGPPEPGYTICLRCFGCGEVTTPARCPACLGAREDWCEGISIPCRVCHGTGRVNIVCPACEGRGWVRQEAREAQREEAPQEQPAETPVSADEGTVHERAVAPEGEGVADGPVRSTAGAEHPFSGSDTGAAPPSDGDNHLPPFDAAERNGKAPS